jgi:hypothetical protein
MQRFLTVPILLLAASLPCAGCGDDDATHELTDVRERDGGGAAGPLTAEERLGALGHGAHGLPPSHAGLPGHGQPAGGFIWKTPEGWTEKPASGMRQASWAVTGEASTDCSFVLLGGEAGGLADNVKRWAGEMGLPAADVPAAADLPRLPFLGKQAAYVNLPGTYNGGRGGGGAVPNARMLGLIVQLRTATAFLKFTGPAKVVEANTAAFEALAASIAPSTSPTAAPVKQPPPVAQPPQPAQPAQPPHAPQTAPASASGFQWDAPAGWSLQRARSMRLFTYQVGEGDGTWCYALLLGGSAGGLEANLDRWRTEMGLAKLTAAEREALPRLEVLGAQAYLLDLAGSFRGTGGPPQAGARMLGLVCPLADQTLFVKMVGPAAAMEGQKEAFVALCTSLRR